MSQNNGHKKLRIDQMEAIWGGSFKRARAALDVSAFGMSVMDLPPGIDQIPPHSHRFDGQEEVYIPLAGSGWIEIDGERVPIDTGTAVRVGPGARRKPISGPEGLSLLTIGGTPGRPYEPFPVSEAGAPEPQVTELPGVREAATTAQPDAAVDDADATFTAKRFDDMEAMSGYFKGVSMTPLRSELGVTSFGIGMITIDPIDDAEYPPDGDRAGRHPRQGLRAAAALSQ
ncbi:MAG: hypothetical protein HZB14_02955 [Actinobacteria bacterium]|nr:hypothetical protein [Actinomycetota bacterium]